MADGGNGVPKAPDQPQAIEIILRWLPQSGQFQVGMPAVDDVIKLGMLAMATQMVQEQRQQMASGKGPSLIVPGRFVQ